eukprot:14646-Heterococcus_DN1.PRE.1
MAEKLIVGPGNPAQRGEDLSRVVLIACATSAMNTNRTKRRTSSGETFESLIERAPAHGEVEKNNEAPKEGVRVVLKKQGGKYWIFCLRGPAEQAREDHKHKEDKRVPPLKELRVLLGDVVEEVQIFHGNNATPNRPSKAMLRYAYTLVSLNIAVLLIFAYNAAESYTLVLRTSHIMQCKAHAHNDFGDKCNEEIAYEILINGCFE